MFRSRCASRALRRFPSFHGRRFALRLPRPHPHFLAFPRNEGQYVTSEPRKFVFARGTAVLISMWPPRNKNLYDVETPSGYFRSPDAIRPLLHPTEDMPYPCAVASALVLRVRIPGLIGVSGAPLGWGRIYRNWLRNMANLSSLAYIHCVEVSIAYSRLSPALLWGIFLAIYASICFCLAHLVWRYLPSSVREF